MRLYRKPFTNCQVKRQITWFPIKSIGYSNLKLAMGLSGGKPDVSLHPAGAAPVDRLPESIGRQENALRVSVDGEMWAVGVHHGKFSQWSRSLHGDYVQTPSYRALFLASLLLSGRDKVDVLVTGLPVSQWLERIEEALRTAKGHVLLFGWTVEIQPYLAQAAERVAPVALEALRHCH